MILGFNKRFVEPIWDGSKIHTIRIDPHDRWYPGRSIQFATGVRTKNYNSFRFDGVCESVQTIKMGGGLSHRTISISVDGRPLARDKFQMLARNDGFQGGTLEFLEWFYPKGDMWRIIEAKILHWTDFRY